jgi:DivIVA domain-containing protein
VDLDRQSIEKRDFPIGRRGYEPEAVDDHLDAIAAEVEALKRQAKARSGESLASMASTQVQAIVEAAESSAADIERQAQSEASRIRQQAQREADGTREDAVERSREHVGRVSEATAVMLQRVDAMESELGALFESLRTGANRLTADLSLLEGNMGELYEAAGGGPSAGPGLGPAGLPSQPAEEPEPVFEQAASGGSGSGEAEHGLAAAEEAGTAAAGNGGAAPGGPGAPDGPGALGAPASIGEAGEGDEEERADDVEGARLIALNMALNGQSREEADRYLADNFDLPDRAGLLDEVYASVQG